MRRQRLTLILPLVCLALLLLPAFFNVGGKTQAILLTSNGHFLSESGSVRVNVNADSIVVVVREGVNLTVDSELRQQELTCNFQDFTIYMFKAPMKVGEYHIKAKSIDFSVISDRIIIEVIEN